MQNQTLPLPVVQELLSVMFHAGLYGDIVGLLDALAVRNSAWRDDADLTGYYGISCYRMGELYASHLYLARSAAIPGARPEVYYELSRVCLDLAKQAPDNATRQELLLEGRRAIDLVLDRDGPGGIYGMQAARVYHEHGFTAEAEALVGRALP
jgi:hypothetical protein